ncbi:serine hydrolase domain-containing protein [Longimicrobium terrae]|uniref:CubicO group peptidase (Beta-lactamase class C family) n=1 Tax=Longimicrobium terrae TaxID=1639882 RepID=A0A841H182_9BACT|nr:serine hydrolase domain-containing protein [Longimicrobium terrae]MBB4637365.1 CubicO group peptidase (beta-lactamase class C family) [Longimicrobium terrae]MBB6071763.1 CubicO group peptidase (beta-lactamase class C family) [Longimicrobium terrae]NNC28523.1 beta-lactamase family protein [Longimicrobium terrae]
MNTILRTIQSRWRTAAGVAVAGIAPVILAMAKTPPASAVAAAPLVAVHAPVAATAATLKPRPAAKPLARAPLTRAVDAVRAEVKRGAFPGAALAAGRGATTSLIEGVGTTTWKGATVDPERTVYDLASLTKVVATTTAAMLLYEDGRLDLDAPVSRYLPEFSGGNKDDVTIRDLLTHTSGLPAGTGVRGSTADEKLASLIRTPLRRAPETRVEYSDVGFVTLFAALEKAAGEPVEQMLERRVYGPLGMASTGYAPGADCARCAPSWQTADGTPVRGKVHDPTARALGGVAGNAGLFSTVADLSRFAAMLAGGGELEGVRVLKPETIDTFSRRQPGADNRALGWETPNADGTGAAGKSMSPRAFGHTGFTGTSLWVDPEHGTWAVLLANRTFDAHASNRIQKLRRTVHAYVTESAEEAPDSLLAD